MVANRQVILNFGRAVFFLLTALAREFKGTSQKLIFFWDERVTSVKTMMPSYVKNLVRPSLDAVQSRQTSTRVFSIVQKKKNMVTRKLWIP